MLTFPSQAKVGRILPKEVFYKRLTMSTELREKFVSDIKRIVVEYKLLPETLSIKKEGEIAEILVLSLDLKKQELDYRIVEAIARQNPHQLLFLLTFEDKAQLALYYSKLYKTQWQPHTDMKLEARGLSMDALWEGFIEQIALQEDIIPVKADLSIADKLKKQETVLRLQKEIEKFERLSRNEKQPKKRFELYTQLQKLKQRLADEKGE